MTVSITDTIIGWVADPDAATSAALPYVTLTEGTWEFGRYRVSRGESSILSTVGTLEINAGGSMLTPVGNAPIQLTLRLLSGGRFLLDWRYDTRGQPATPTGFQVFYDLAGTWTAEGDVTTYSENRSRYQWVSTNYTDGTERTYIVRTCKYIDPDTFYELNEVSVTGTADADGPGAIATISATFNGLPSF